MKDDIIISHDLFRQKADTNDPEPKKSIQRSIPTLGRDTDMGYGLVSSFHFVLLTSFFLTRNNYCLPA